MATLGNSTHNEPQEEIVNEPVNPAPEPTDTAEAFTDTQSAEPLAPNPKDTTNQCCINDTETPILVLFGPSQCGKSMTMVRLVRYLQSQNYTVEPRHDFRPASDKTYELRCREFNNTINTYVPLPGTDWEDYMLVTVYDRRGNSVLQILEAPGEAYFSLKEDNPLSKPYPAYLNRIKSCIAPKIWCFFIEPNWKEDRYSEYVERIKRARSFINLSKDKIIILYNKVDTQPQYIKYGKINIKALTNFADQQYKGLFNAFKNDRLGESLWRPYLCEFVPFSTGDYSGGDFVESHDSFPASLCKKIIK